MSQQSEEFAYKTLFNKETWLTMPNGTPGFYFSIGGNLETALFDTGSLINVVDPPTADKIGIEEYPPAKDLLGPEVPGYLVCVNVSERHLVRYQPPLRIALQCV
jgi:hypothetical protein